MAIKKIIEFVVNSKGAKKDLGDIDKSLNDINTSQTKVTQSSKGMANSVKGTSMATRGLNNTLKATRIALNALGIGAILSVVGLLSEALLKNQTILDGVEKVLNVVSGTTQAVVNTVVDLFKSTGELSDRFSKLTGVLRSLVTLGLTPVKLNFQGLRVVVTAAIQGIVEALGFLGLASEETVEKAREATKEAGNAFKDVLTDAKEAAIDVAENGREAMTELGELAKETAVSISETTKSMISLKNEISDLSSELEFLKTINDGVLAGYANQAEELKRIRDDESLTFNERIKASQDYKNLIEESNRLRVEQASLELEIAGKQLQANESNQELQVAYIAAANKLREVQSSAERETTRWFRRDQRLRNNQMRQIESVNEALSEGYKDELEEIEAVYEAQVELINKIATDSRMREELLSKASKRRLESIQEVKDAEEASIRDISNLYLTEIETRSLKENELHNSRVDRINSEVSNVEERNRLLELEEVRHREAMQEIESTSADRIAEILREARGYANEEEKLEYERDERIRELEELEASEEAKFQLMELYENKLSELRKNSAKEEEENRRKVMDANVKLTAGAIGAISEAFLDNNDLMKGVSAVEATWNTYQGITEALKAPTMTQRIAGIAFATATGFGAVKSILSSDRDNISGGNPRSNVANVPPQFDVVGDARQDALDDINAEDSNKPVKAYVVTGEVESGLAADRNRMRNSRFL